MPHRNDIILVTGATGFLGHNLCPYLIERGYRVRALVRPTSDCGFLRDLGVELAFGDVRNLEETDAAVAGLGVSPGLRLRRALGLRLGPKAQLRRRDEGLGPKGLRPEGSAERCRAVVHAAGKFRFWGRYDDFYETNVKGTLDMLEAALAAGVERFIYISTIAVAGAPRSGAVIDEDYPPNPQDAYQRSKVDAERMVLRYHQVYGLPTLILRPGAYYGPWGRYAFNRLFFEDPLKGIPFRVHGSRHITFPVYIRDVARGIELALERGRPGELYNICGPSLSHREVDQVVDRVVGYPVWRVNMPGWMMLALARAWTLLSRFTGREPYYPINLAPYVFCDWEVSIEKARRELGFEPTPFEEGVRATLAWYREQGLLRPPWWTRILNSNC